MALRSKEKTNERNDSHKNRLFSTSKPRSNASRRASHPFRRLVIFQLKLALDALRDILLSPVSLICGLLDLISNSEGENSYFERLMRFGCYTEKRINLFEQHFDEAATVDNLVNQVETILVDEYKNKNISKKTLSAIQSSMNKKRTKN